MEQCAFIAASRVARGGYLLTAAMDSISFLNPTRVGDNVYVEGQVTAIFGSSVEVQISLWGETPDVGGMFHCGDAYATVVSGARRVGRGPAPWSCCLLVLLPSHQHLYVSICPTRHTTPPPPRSRPRSRRRQAACGHSL